MYPQDEYALLKDYELNRLPAILEKGRHRVLLREAGLEGNRWLSCQVCRSLWQLGHALVAAGQRLEHRFAYAAPRPAQTHAVPGR